VENKEKVFNWKTFKKTRVWILLPELLWWGGFPLFFGVLKLGLVG